MEQEISNHPETCVSENTGTAPEITTNSGNCSTSPEADKDLRIQELQEQLKEAVNELNILKKVREKKGLKCSDLKSDKEVNLLTGIPKRAAFDALFDMVKENVKKLRYWTGPVKSTRKGQNFKKSPNKFY